MSDRSLVELLRGLGRWLLEWVRFFLWPPFVLEYIMVVVGFYFFGEVGGYLGAIIWFLLMMYIGTHSHQTKRWGEPILDWYEQLWEDYRHL